MSGYWPVLDQCALNKLGLGRNNQQLSFIRAISALTLINPKRRNRKEKKNEENRRPFS